MDEPKVNPHHHHPPPRSWSASGEDALSPAQQADFQVWERIIQREAELLTAAIHRSPEEIDRLAARALSRLRHNSLRPSGTTFSFSEAVFLLRSLLDPLCGPGAARNAVTLATDQSCPRGHREVSAANWTLFVRNLGAAIGSVYGEPARLLTERVGGLVGAGLP